jgi:hypothetical protein
MKVGGVNVTSCEETLVLPRGGEGNDIPFIAKAVSINEEFDTLVQMPIPPMKLVKGGKKLPDLADPTFKISCKLRDGKRFDFLMLRSLEPSNIEWSEVDMEKPNTWAKWKDELIESGISDNEIQRIVGAVMIANSLDEDKIKEARDSFLHGQGV